MIGKMTAIVMFTVSIGALSTACGSSDGGDACSMDNDCKGDRICEGGECVSPGDGNTTDSTTTDSNTTDSNTTDSNNTDSNTTDLNNTDWNNEDEAEGAIGSECSSHSDCDSNYCRKPASAFDGTCAENDFGETCRGSDDCVYDICLVNDPEVDVVGFCSTTCESFTDCPTFWSCEELGNGAGTYCVQD